MERLVEAMPVTVELIEPKLISSSTSMVYVKASAPCVAGALQLAVKPLVVSPEPVPTTGGFDSVVKFNSEP